MKKRMIIVTALIMGTLGAGCVSVQASDTLPELTKDNAHGTVHFYCNGHSVFSYRTVQHWR